MIKKSFLFRNFERGLLRRKKVDVKENFRIMEAMYQEAVALGVFPPENPLDGLGAVLKIAKVINGVSKTTGRESKKVFDRIAKEAMKK